MICSFVLYLLVLLPLRVPVEAALGLRDFFQDLRTAVAPKEPRQDTASIATHSNRCRPLQITAISLPWHERKSRHREKGRQATGPLWLHLAAQAARCDKL